MGFVFRRGLPSLVIFVISSPLLALHLSLVACIWGKLRQGKHKHDGDGQWLTNEFRKALCEAAARVVAAGFALRSKGKYDVGSRKDERKRHPFSFLLANQPFLYSIPSASACPASFLFVEDFPSGLAVWRMANGERLSSQFSDVFMGAHFRSTQSSLFCAVERQNCFCFSFFAALLKHKLNSSSSHRLIISSHHH